MSDIFCVTPSPVSMSEANEIVRHFDGTYEFRQGAGPCSDHTHVVLTARGHTAVGYDLAHAATKLKNTLQVEALANLEPLP